MSTTKRKRQKTGGVAHGTYPKKSLAKDGLGAAYIKAMLGRKHEVSNEGFAYCIAALLQYEARPDAQLVSVDDTKHDAVFAVNSPRVIREVKTDQEARDRLEGVVEFILGWLTKDTDDDRHQLPYRLRALADLIEVRPIKPTPFPRPKTAKGPPPIPTYAPQPADAESLAVTDCLTFEASRRISKRRGTDGPGSFNRFSDAEILAEINKMSGADREQALRNDAPSLSPRRIGRLVKQLFKTKALPRGPRPRRK